MRFLREVRQSPRPASQQVFQSVADEDSYLGSWLYIYVDFQGPLTESEEGYRYILTYTCRLLRTPILVPCNISQKDDSMQDVSSAMLRMLTIPVYIRHDRGQEFGSAVLRSSSPLWA